MIQNNEKGVFFPQNKEYVKTSELVKLIAESNGKKILETKVFNPVLRLMGSYVGVVNKAFGSLVYEKNMSDYREEYRVRDFKDSIRNTEV